MRVLQTAFAGEGVTDFDFLKPLVARILEELLIEEADEDCEVGAPLDVKPHDKAVNTPAAVVREVLRNYAFVDMLFYHTDAGNSVPRAYSERVAKVVTGLQQAGWPGEVVGVVPRREMEAWALADSTQLCAVLGVAGSKVAVPLDFRPNRVEGITHPKEALASFVEEVRDRSRGVAGGQSLFAALSQRLTMHLLLQVPQVQAMRQDLKRALERQGVLLR